MGWSALARLRRFILLAQQLVVICVLQGAAVRLENTHPACLSFYQDIGSILLGRTRDEEASLGARQARLAAAGVSASLLNDMQLRALEPSLGVAPGSSGLLVESDAQLVTRSTPMQAAQSDCQQVATIICHILEASAMAICCLTFVWFGTNCQVDHV